MPGDADGLLTLRTAKIGSRFQGVRPTPPYISDRRA
jgi:hypothetical protein